MPCPVSPSALKCAALGFLNKYSDGHVSPPPSSKMIGDGRKVLVVFTHPQGSSSYASAMLDATVRGLNANESVGTTRVRRLYYESSHRHESYNGADFPAALTRDERAQYLTDETMVARATPEGLGRLHAAQEVQDAVADLRWCDSVVFVHPVWWFNFPAVLKGFFDRVLLPGVAFRLPDGTSGQRVEGGLVPLLNNISRIGVVTSYGSGFWTASMLDGTRPFISRVFRGLCAEKCMLQWTALYEMDTKDLQGRQEHLKEVEDTFRVF